MRSLACLPLLLLLAGCQSPSLVGEWKAEGLMNQVTQSSYTIRADGTFESQASIATPMGIPMQVNATGTWTLRGNNFKTQVKDLDVMGFELPAEGEEDSELLRDARRARQSGTIQWLNPNAFNLIADRTGTVIRFRRVVPEGRDSANQKPE